MIVRIGPLRRNTTCEAPHGEAILRDEETRHKRDSKQGALRRTPKLRFSFLHAAAILKLLHHDNIVKCFRMLKTSNNIYLIYTYKEGPTLQELLD